jgi:hypothetical protein
VSAVTNSAKTLINVLALLVTAPIGPLPWKGKEVVCVGTHTYVLRTSYFLGPIVAIHPSLVIVMDMNLGE